MDRILSGVRRPQNTHAGVQPAWSTPDRIGIGQLNQWFGCQASRCSARSDKVSAVGKQLTERAWGLAMYPTSARRYHWVILALVILAQFIPSLVLFSIGALAPLLRDSLSLSHEQIGFLAALFSMSAALFAIPSGWGADKL